VREGCAGWPTWLPVSAIAVLSAACTSPNPRYVAPPPARTADAAAEAARADAGPADADPTRADAPPDDLAAGDAADPPAPDAPGAPDGPAESALDPTPTAGLVAHWPLDEGEGASVADATGNQNDGMLVNGPTWLVAAAPTVRPNPTALRLDGADDYVDLAVRTLPRAEANKTIGVWFRNSAQTPRLRNLVSLFNEADTTGIHLGFDADKVAAWRWGDFDPVVVSLDPPDGGWHHLAYTWDGTTHRLYLDGALVGSTVATVRAGPVDTARFGTWRLPQEVFGGDLDEVRVYDRVLLPTEISALASRP
jgi:hypothetical protein